MNLLYSRLLFYREKLFNKSIEQLKLERENELTNKDQQVRSSNSSSSSSSYISSVSISSIS